MMKSYLWSYKITYFNHLAQSYNKKSLMLNAEIEKGQEQEMHVNKKWKEEKWMIQKGSEAHGMAKPKENQTPMEGNKI